MRAFAFLSLAAVAFAAPLVAPGGVVDAVAGVAAPVKAVVGAVTGVNANVDGAVGNVDAQYNQIGNNDLNGNKIHVLRDVTVKNVVSHSPPKVDIPYTKVNAITHKFNPRASLVSADVLLTAILKALVDLATKANVDAYAAIANIRLDYNQILNNVGNGNTINVGKRAVVSVLGDILAAIFAVVQSCLKANIPVEVLIANVQLTCNQIANGVANNNNVNVARSAVAAVLPIATFIQAFVVAVTHICADITVDILNIALSQNQIANGLLDSNTINLLS